LLFADVLVEQNLQSFVFDGCHDIDP